MVMLRAARPPAVVRGYDAGVIATFIALAVVCALGGCCIGIALGAHLAGHRLNGDDDQPDVARVILAEYGEQP
jgi:hypothetical protein